MKTIFKSLCMILSLTCMLALLSLVASATTAIEGRKTVEILKVDTEKTPITLDGEIEDIWKGANAITLDVVHTDVSDANAQPGVNCATGTVKLLWSGEAYLYMLFEIVDNTPAAVSINPWENDAIVFMTDWYNDGQGRGGRFERICYDYGIGEGAAYSYGAKITDTGYVIEVGLITEPYVPGDYIGLDFEIDDGREDGLRYAAIGWSYDKNNGWETNSGYGQGLLSDTEVQIPVDEPDTPSPDTADTLLSVAVVAVSLAAAGIVIGKKRQTF